MRRGQLSIPNLRGCGLRDVHIQRGLVNESQTTEENLGSNKFSTTTKLDGQSFQDLDQISRSSFGADFPKHITRHSFHNAYKYLKENLPNTEVNTDYSFPPYENLRHIIETNANTPPKIGSVVEFVEPAIGEPTGNEERFGIVISELKSRFNPNYNELIVLSMTNELVLVSPLYVNFHSHQVVNPDWIESLCILKNKFIEEHEGRLQLVNVLQGFLNESLSYNELLQSSFDIIYSQYSQDHSIKNILLVQMIESIRFPEEILSSITTNYFHQSSLLMALHLQFSRSSAFISLSNWGHRSTNVGKYGSNYSNQIIHGTSYFINSVENANSINIFTSVCQSERFQELNKFLRTVEFLDQDPALYFLFWEGRTYNYIITVMKFSILYPHNDIIENLKRLDIFKTASPREVYQWLEKINLYNQSTDIFLSSNTSGKPKLKRLSLGNTDEIEQVVNHDKIKKPRDLFRHLRNSKKYYKDHVIYALPGTPLGISLEKINSRKYLLNMHVPDIMTSISPSSELFSIFLSLRYNLISMKDMNQLFGTFVEEFIFRNQKAEDGTLADLFKNRLLNTTCMTVSFTYNTFDSNPFHDVKEKISISFDSLSSVTIKKLDITTLETSLKEQSTLASFKLFKRDRPDDVEEFITNDDRHNLRFIYNILRTNLKVRNQNGAAELIQIAGRSGFFIREADVLLGDIVSRYAANWNIPIYVNTQDILESTVENDEILISHNNSMLPTYNASTFGEAMFVKDQTGHVSLAAKTIGANYLAGPKLEVSNFASSTVNIPMGFKLGYVDISNVFTSVESLLNQLQLLNNVQLQYNNQYLQGADRDQKQLVQRFGYLKRYGYNLHGPLDGNILNEQLLKIKNSSELSKYLGTERDRFEVLRNLKEGELTELFKCVITHHGYTQHTNEELLDQRIAYGYCLELGIEVNVSSLVELNIGSTVNCDSVVFVDEFSGVCMLKQEDVY